MTIRFGVIARENDTKFLCDYEELKEYPLNRDTIIALLNHLNNEILDYEGMLIELGEKFKEEVENQEGLILGNVPRVQFNTICDVLGAGSKIHKKSLEKMYEEYGAFDKEGKLK